ncbi:MAG: M20/M25/M40 family metallo-hydrolase [Candidatus Heimdallarchaeota archaeon]|nr:M20/M25/M40 family metallo-hydrolase [Candidatus Heimdallarchaeota archaeon]
METSLIEETYDLLQQLIQNKCVNPPGNEMRNIKTIEKFLSEKGVSCEIYESAEQRGNLVARIKGKEESPKLMFGPSHVDVVPVDNPEEWDVSPFSGKVKDSYIWGRGAIDMLFIVATQVQAFAALFQEDFEPKGDLVLLIVSDEETGGQFGAEWMLKNHPEMVETDYAVTEAGGIPIAPGKFVITIGEKGGAWKRISFTGTPGHGSMPYGSNNAVLKAAEAAKKLKEYTPPITTEYLGHLAKGMGVNKFTQFLMTKKIFLPFILKRLKKNQPLVAKVIHGLSRMTISPNIIKGGTKVNMIPSSAYLDVDIRTLPGQDEEYVHNHLMKALGELAAEAKISELEQEEGFMSYGNSSPAKSDFVSAMERAIQKEIPDSSIVPFIMTGVSDARFFRERDVETYGFSLFDPELSLSDFANLAHGTNERVSLKTVELTLKAHYNLAKEFLG